MNYAQIIKIKGLQLTKVNYFTIRVEENDNPEFMDFANRMVIDTKNKEEFQELLVYIKEIGNKYGAKKDYFRHESAAEALALPKVEHIDFESNNEDFGLRIYCLRLSESVVILLNGDRKTKQKAQDCPNCAKHFKLANRIAKSINTAIIEKDILIRDKELLIENDFELIF